MEPVEYLKVLRRRWRLITVVAYLVMVAAFLTTPTTPPPSKPIREFRATAVLLSNSSSQGAAAAATNVANLAFLVTTGEVPRRVAKSLGFEGDPAILARRVQATGEKTLNIVRVASTGAEGAETARLANSFATELMLFLEQTQLTLRQQQIDDALARMRTLEASIAERDARAAAPGASRVEFIKAERDALIRQYGLTYDRLQVIQGQAPPTSGLTLFEEATPIPVFRSTAFRAPSSRLGRAGMGLVVGLLLGAGLAIALQRLDRRIYSKERAEVAFDLPVIAEIPSGRRRSRRHKYEIEIVAQTSSTIAVSYRRLRTSTLLMRVLRQTPLPYQHTNGNGNRTIGDDKGDELAAGPRSMSFTANGAAQPASGPRVLLVSSPVDMEDKTITVANLAAGFAEMGQSVLVLGCDFSHPTIHHFFGVGQSAGLRDLLAAGGAVGDLGNFVQQTRVPGVSLVCHGDGSGSPAELVLHGSALVARARELADVVIIDAGPLLVSTEASDLAPYVDAVILTARVGRTTVDSARRSTELLGRLGAPVLGVVLVGSLGIVRPTSVGSAGPRGDRASEGSASDLAHDRPGRAELDKGDLGEPLISGERE